MRLPRNADTRISARSAEAQLKMMLTNARTIEHFTVDGLARMYRVDRKTIEYLLTIERQNRARAVTP